MGFKKCNTNFRLELSVRKTKPVNKLSVWGKGEKKIHPFPKQKACSQARKTGPPFHNFRCSRKLFAVTTGKDCSIYFSAKLSGNFL